MADSKPTPAFARAMFREELDALVNVAIEAGLPLKGIAKDCAVYMALTAHLAGLDRKASSRIAAAAIKLATLTDDELLAALGEDAPEHVPDPA